MTVIEYILNLEEENQIIMNKLREMLLHKYPNALEKISYGVPCLYEQKTFIYYAAFIDHISVFPPLPSDHYLIPKVMKYKNKKGNLIFSKKEMIPYDLILEVSESLYQIYHQ